MLVACNADFVPLVEHVQKCFRKHCKLEGKDNYPNLNLYLIINSGQADLNMMMATTTKQNICLSFKCKSACALIFICNFNPQNDQKKT